MSYFKKKFQELTTEDKAQGDYWGKKMAELERQTSKVDSTPSRNVTFLQEMRDQQQEVFDAIKRKAREREDTDDDRKWFEKGEFADGYQFGDVFKTIYGSVVDLKTNIGEGILGMGEKIVDAGAYVVGGVGGLFSEDFKDDVADFIADDLYDEGKVARTLLSSPAKLLGVDSETDSVFGEKTDALAQSGGQLLATAGLQAVGVPWYLTTGVTSFGSEVENAFNQGATYGQAGLSAAINAGVEIATEKLFGGSGLGEKGLINLDGLTKGISNKVGKALLDFGIDMTGEGLEEVASQIGSNFATTLYSEKNWQELVLSEEAFDEYLESFIGGMALGGFANVGKVSNSIKTGRDYRTGLTESEQKVFDNVYNKRVAEAQEGGKELSKKEKAAIYDSVMNDLKKGRIDTDTIEEVLGGEEYETYKKSVEEKDALQKEYDEFRQMKKGDLTVEQDERYNEVKQKLAELKNSKASEQAKLKLSEAVQSRLVREVGKKGNLQSDNYLIESYNEKARGQQKFETDLSQYDVKQQDHVKRALESGVLNNRNSAHDIVGLTAKIEADKGVRINYVNNKIIKDMGDYVEGVDNNGFVKDGVLYINVDSPKYLNFTVGHEITHTVEQAGLYAEMQKALFDVAKAKGEYDSRLKKVTETYKKYDPKADPTKELTADLVGDYLFTDEDFVKRLSTEHRNVFQKVWDEIKHLWKMATAGSKEARELEKAMHLFEKVYRESGKASEGTKYSISDSDGKQLSKGQQEYFKDSKMRDENGNLKVMYHGSQDAGFHVFDPAHSDDDTSLFFVDRNDVAASYSGTSETYEAKTIRSAEDMNKFLAEIGYDEDYSVVEKEGKFELIYDGDRVATSDTAQGIYEEFCWYEGVGDGDANYKVYLNLTNPLVVDAEGRNWNNITREYSQEVADRYNSLTAEEKAALSNLAEWGEYSIFKDEMLDARAAAEQGVSSGYGDVAFTKTLARAYAKLGGANANLYDAFSIASDNFSAESIQEFAVKQMNTRDYAQKAKAEGYDGVIFNNLVDVGGFGNGSEGASTVAIAFDSNQIKSVANEQPGKNADIRYSLSEADNDYISAVESGDMETAQRLVDEAAKNAGYKVRAYHGSRSKFTVFDKSKGGQSNSNAGIGFWFTESKEGAKNFADDTWYGNVDEAQVYDTYLKLDNPKVYKPADNKEQIETLREQSAVIDREMSLLDSTYCFEDGRYYHTERYDYDHSKRRRAGYADWKAFEAIAKRWGADDVEYFLSQVAEADRQIVKSDGERYVELAKQKKQLTSEITELSYGDSYEQFRTDIYRTVGKSAEDANIGGTGMYIENNGEVIKNFVAKLKSEGYDGIIIEDTEYDSTTFGGKNNQYVVFEPSQIKSAETVTYDDAGNVIPLSERFNAEKDDIRNSLSAKGEQQKRYGNYHIYGKDVRFEAPMQEQVAPVVDISKTETVENFAPMPSEPMSYELRQEQERLIEEAKKATDTETVQSLYARYNELEQRAAQLEAEETEAQSESLAHLDDVDAPPEMEAPYYGETQDAAPIDPFEDRDMKEVSKDRKTPAYMYENPEVKPFFQAEANVLLGELESVQKPETYYNGWIKQGLSYEANDLIPEIYRTKRIASDTIVDLRDNIGMSYADIEKGLKAIIEDNGAENIAAAKKLEFVINDRLLNGYYDDFGYEIPANQDYINLLTEKQIREYSEEARKQFFDVADAYDPMADIAPVAATTEETSEVPVKEQYEAIKPERKKSTEPRLKRVKDGETSSAGKERKWIGTSTESEAVDGKVKPDDIPDDMRYYQPIPNKVTLGNANTRLDSMGYDVSLSYFNSQFANKRVSLDDIALGERLIQEAVKRGDTKTASELIQNVSILGTELGQKVQALSIIKRLSPEGQLSMLQKTVERGKTRGDKSFEGVEITQEMIDHILKTYGKDGTYDQTKLNEAVEDVKKQIADQMKVTKLEKVNAWRYLSMLGNPKTHIRNLVSNVAMQGTVAVKNAVARTIETVAPIGNRTKTWKRASDAVKTFSQKTALEMKDVLSDGGKYSEEASIKEKRDTFKNKVLNKVYNFNSDMLSKEDWWFSKPAFTNALSEYLTANGIVTEQDIANNPKIVAKAKQYATEQSQIATFRQYSWLANKINEIEHRNVATNIAVGAILPFKKTPINIAKTGLNYSPLGFAKTLTYDAVQVKNGKMEASELVDHLSQNITGSALTLVGYLLASSGFLNGAGEDDKEGEYDYQLGEQAYSITIGDATYSLSWLSPIAMPLFVGANAYEQLVEGKEWNGDVVVQTLAQTLDPLSEMSFLSSLDSVLSSYDSGIMKFAGIAQTAAQSYTTQFAPTLLSQVAAVMDDTKRTTKVAGDSTFKAFDEIINNLKYKIPGLRETLEPTTDIWGNEVKQTEDMLTRAFETFIAPYSKREDIATEIDSEIKSLYGMTGDDGLIPSIPYNYVNYKGEKYEMSAKDYTAYKEAYGQTAYNLLGELFDTETYRYASDEDKAEMVNKVYDYARDIAKQEFLAKKGVTYTNAKEDGEEIYRDDSIKGAIEHDMMLDEYTFYREYPEKYAVAKSVGGYDRYKTYQSDLYDIKADKDANGKTISGSRKEKVADYINGLDISYEEKIILFKSEYNADDTYNYEIIEYLNNRNDISYEEMVAILRELGFTVKGNTVTWD